MLVPTMARSNFQEYVRRVRDHGKAPLAQRLAKALGALLAGALGVLLLWLWLL